MDNSETKSEALDRFTSWAAFLLVVVSAGLFGWYVPLNRQAMLPIFKDFAMKLPQSTAAVCAVPTSVIAGLSAVAAASALLVQLRIRSKRSASVFHLLLVFMFGVLFLVYREAMGSAMMSLVQAVSPGGR